MGFRSTLVSQDYQGELPNWFKKKYNDYILFSDGLTVSSKREAKFYTNEFFEDYQKAVNESGFWDDKSIEIIIVVLAEDGSVSKVVISNDEIKYYILMDELYEAKSVWNGGYFKYIL